jgi:hypothetical protein
VKTYTSIKTKTSPVSTEATIAIPSRFVKSPPVLNLLGSMCSSLANCYLFSDERFIIPVIVLITIDTLVGVCIFARCVIRIMIYKAL